MMADTCTVHFGPTPFGTYKICNGAANQRDHVYYSIQLLQLSPYNSMYSYDVLPRKDIHYTRSNCRGNIVLSVLECTKLVIQFMYEVISPKRKGDLQA